MNTFLNELKGFSKENWWIYPIVIIILIIVVYTGKWNPVSVWTLFIINFIANLFIMAAMNSYSEKKNIAGANYHVLATITFAWLWIYGIIYLWHYQYIIWQIAYSLAAIKAFSFYTYNKNIKIFNEKTFIVLNLIFLSAFLYYFDFHIASLLQALGFSFVTTWLVSISDKIRFWMSYLWMFGIVWGSAIFSYYSFIDNSLDWVALGYLLLGLTVFVYFSRLLKKYI